MLDSTILCLSRERQIRLLGFTLSVCVCSQDLLAGKCFIALIPPLYLRKDTLLFYDAAAAVALSLAAPSDVLSNCLNLFA